MNLSTSIPIAARRVLVPPHINPVLPALGSVVHRFAGRSMGTSWSVCVAGSPQIDIERVQQGIEHELNTVVMQMSTWEAESDLSRFNHAAAESWLLLPMECFEVLHSALQVAAESDGAFDPTAGPLINLWGFGPIARYQEAGFHAPNLMMLAAARRLCGWQRVELDATAQRVRQPGGVYIDLSAIAKGFAVDQVARWLGHAGFTSFLVEIGGELYGAGVKPDGQPWWVALERPPRCEADNDVVALHGLSVATSGDYRRWYETDDGLRRSHTIDPRNGFPIAHGLASVTVLHASCMLADAWSTALSVLGSEHGLQLAETKGLFALFITRRADGGFDETMSTGFAALVQ